MKNKAHFLIINCIISILITFILCGCSTNTTEYSKSGFAFDTVIQINIYDTDKIHANNTLEECFNICNYYDSLFNISDTDSDIYKINHANGSPVVVSEDTIDIISKSIHYSEISNGYFDITIEPLYELWAFNEEKHDKIPSESEIQNALKTVDYKQINILDNNTVLIPSNCKINLGALAKGYISDKIKEYLLTQNISSALINLGGNVLTIGSKPNGKAFNIGIQKPYSNTGEIITGVNVSDQSVVTSGTYQRYFTYNDKSYHHIIDPFTGYPVENSLASATIIAECSTDADAFSTICMLYGYKNAKEFINAYDKITVIMVDNDGNIL